MISLRIDLASFIAAGDRFEKAAKLLPSVQARAINHTGDKARTAVRRALVPQTGLKPKTINKAVQSTRATAKGSVAYVIKSRGGDIRLQFFGARETRAGVTAAPWGKRRLYASTFMKAGQFPNRVSVKGFHGNVMYRTGKGRYPVRVKKSGLFIPEEMVTGASAQAFFDTVNTALPARIAHELDRVL